MRAFADSAQRQKKDLLVLLLKLKSEGKSIAGVSAPAKGNTLLNFCHIDTSLLDFTTERNELKVFAETNS